VKSWNLEWTFTTVTFFFSIPAFAGQTLGDLAGKTIVPVEIRTPYISCNGEDLVRDVTDAKAGKSDEEKAAPKPEAQLWQGKFRHFLKSEVNSADIANGLNYIVSGKGKCQTHAYDMFSITGADFEHNTIAIRHLNVGTEHLGRVENKFHDQIESLSRSAREHENDGSESEYSTEYCSNLATSSFLPLFLGGSLTTQTSCYRNSVRRQLSERSAFDSEAGAAMALYALACPWDKLLGAYATTPETNLNCQIIPRQSPGQQANPQPSSRVAKWVGSLFGQKKQEAPAQQQPQYSLLSDNPDEVAAYFRQNVKFSLQPSRGLFETVGEKPVDIESYLVCRDASGANLIAFAVMEKLVTGLNYMCR
jgi:hypothetical protein